MKKRIATAWLTGCSGCHMSFLDLDDGLIDLLGAVDLVYSPIADVKAFPPDVDVALVEGAVSTSGNLELAKRIRANSRVVVAFGDCAATGNVPALRNRMPVPDLMAAVYGKGFPGGPPSGGTADELPGLLPVVLPLHRAIAVDAFVPGCPPGPERIRAALAALLEGKPLALPEEMRTFG